MDIYRVPPFVITKRMGKNVIKKLICDEIPIASYRSENGVLELIDISENKIFIYNKNDTISPDAQYVLVCNKCPDFEKIKNNEISLHWIRHPDFREEIKPRDVCNSWDNCFSYKEENPALNEFGLRTPQIGAIHAVLSHWKVSEEIGTVVMPTGTGKTETMLSLLIVNKCMRLLVTVPTDALREQLSNKFFSLGVLRKFEIVSSYTQTPIVGIVNEKFRSATEARDFMNQCNVIVTTMSIASGSMPEVQKEFANLCSHYFIDEAHHVKAQTWNDFVKRFDPRKVIQFTATPYRNDGQQLEGNIVFNYPLKKAQNEGYFKPIIFNPIWEFSSEKADAAIAEAAIQVLRNDILKGHKQHIVMARCKDKKRADEVFEYYKKFKEFHPVKLYSGSAISSSERLATYEAILNKKTNIIVCVDMLGEGFDLPELKIAAFHDVKKSLPVTLQLAGRFTRTKYDDSLGEATFIANLADTDVSKELEELYAQDADWNTLLPKLSNSQIEEELKVEEFIKGFMDNEIFKFPLQNMRPALSSVVYFNSENRWYPDRYRAGLQLGEHDKIVSILNPKENALVLVLGRKKAVEWGNFKEIHDIEWTLIIVFRDIKNKLLFIHSSDNSSLYTNLATEVIGKKAIIVDKMLVFKAFYGINRVRLQNVGLKEFLGKNIRFRMSVGSDVEEALSLAEKKKAQKAFVFGSGFERGQKVSLGCSYKGRIWTRLQGNIKQLTDWCNYIGSKLIDPAIDPNTLLKDTLIPKLITEIPLKQPIWIDWDEII